MKKHLLLTVCTCLILTAVHAQLTSYVGIVRAMPNQEAADFYATFAQDLTDRGLKTYAAAVNSYAKAEFFGSGFVYVAPDGQNYIITNSHVVGNASVLSIEFQHQDGKIEKYDDLSVFAVSAGLDLAMLAFPASKPQPFKQGLPFSEAPLTDGQAIWSAGFPGLGNTPLWQFGNGVITNAAARVPDLVNPAISTLIQHSAQVDSGNSGGPLLIEDAKSPLKYAVIGINTWKARGRQAANFAIPAKAIQQFIAEVFANQADPDKKPEVQKAADEFIAAATAKNSAYIETAKYVSYKYAYSGGAGAFKKFLETAPSNVRQEIAAVFLNFSPLEAIRYVIAWQIVQQIHPDETTAPKVDAITPAGATGFNVTISYMPDKPALNSVWSAEQGAWRVMGFAEIAPEDKKPEGKKTTAGLNQSSKVKFSFPYSFFLNASYNLEFPINAGSHGFGLSFMYYGKKSFIGYGAFYERDSVYAYETDTWGYATGSKTYIGRNNFGAILGLRVPLDFGVVNLMPYVNANLGMTMFNKSFMANITINPGLYMGIGVKSKVNGLLGLSYKWKKDIMGLDSSSYKAKNMFSVSAVLAF